MVSIRGGGAGQRVRGPGQLYVEDQKKKKVTARDPLISPAKFLAKWVGKSNEQNAGIKGAIFVKLT